MADQPKPVSPVKMSTGFERLLQKPDFARRIATAKPELIELLDQMQRDGVNDENRSTAGELMYAFKLLREGIEIAASLGAAVLEAEEKKKTK